MLAEVHFFVRELKGGHEPVVLSALVAHESGLIVWWHARNLVVCRRLKDTRARQTLIALDLLLALLTLLTLIPLLIFFFLLALSAVMHAEAILSEVVDVMMFMEEGKANLANGDITSKAKIIVLLIGRAESITQEEILQCFNWHFCLLWWLILAACLIDKQQGEENLFLEVK